MEKGLDLNFYRTAIIKIFEIIKDPLSSIFEQNYIINGYRNLQNNNSSARPNSRLFGCKEWISASGLNLYDVIARYHDPATARFTTPDLLLEKYYPLSPHIYCAANPINLIDPSGMIMKYAGTAEEVAILQEMVLTMMESPIFSYIFSSLDNAEEVFTLQFGTVDDPNKSNSQNQTSSVDYPSGCEGVTSGNNVTLNLYFASENTRNGGLLTLGEETYHLYQKIIPDYSNDNIEFEAKTISLFEINDTYVGRMIPGDLSKWSDYLLENFEIIKAPLPLVFEQNYLKYGAKFVESNKNNKAKFYKTPVNCVPQRFRDVIRNSKLNQ